jgi:hypothetical protein
MHRTLAHAPRINSILSPRAQCMRIWPGSNGSFWFRCGFDGTGIGPGRTGCTIELLHASEHAIAKNIKFEIGSGIRDRDRDPGQADIDRDRCDAHVYIKYIDTCIYIMIICMHVAIEHGRLYMYP